MADKILGIGGAGNNIVSEIGDGCIAIDTDEIHLSKIGKVEKIAVKFETNVNGIIKLANESEKKVLSSIKGCERCFLIAGLGGTTGTNGITLISRIARLNGSKTTAVVILPFKVEQKRVDLTKKEFSRILSCVDSLFVIKNDYLTKKMPNETMINAFHKIGKIAASTIRQLQNSEFFEIYGLLEEKNDSNPSRQIKINVDSSENIFFGIYRKDELQNAVFRD